MVDDAGRAHASGGRPPSASTSAPAAPTPAPAAPTPAPAARAAPASPPGSPGSPAAAPPDAWVPVPDDDGPPPEALSHKPRAVVFHVLFGLAGLVLVLNLVVGVFVGMLQIFFPDAALTEQFTAGLGAGSRSDLFWQTVFSLVLFAVFPLAWVYGTRVRPWLGGNRYLGFRDFGPAALRGAGLGVALMFGAVVLIVVYTVATDGVGALTDPPEDDGSVAAGIANNLTVPLALFIAFTAGFGEEVLFRGVLQKWLGWWPQAIVFGLMHAAGGEPLQLLVTTLIGLLFGWLVHRGHSLWLVVVAHFTYDIGLLSATLVFA